MQIQPVLMTTFGKIHLCPDPVLASLDLRQPSRGFGFDKRFSLAFFTLASSFGNEQTPIAERSDEVGEILVRLSLEHVVDPIGSPKIGHQAVGTGTGRTGVTTLVETHMRMVLQKHG